MQNPTSLLHPKIIRRHESALLSEAETGGLLCLQREQFTAGRSFHSHTQSGQRWFFIETGRFDFHSEGERFQLQEHDLVILPGTTDCSLTCPGNSLGSVVHGLIPNAPERSPSAPRPQVRRRNEAPCQEIATSAVWLLTDAAAMDDRFQAVIIETPSLNDSPLPLQGQSDRVFLILNGRYEFQISDARVQVEAGDVVWVPGGTMIQLRVVSTGSGQLLTVFEGDEEIYCK